MLFMQIQIIPPFYVSHHQQAFNVMFGLVGATDNVVVTIVAG